MKINDSYITKDLAERAFLLASEAKLIQIEEKDSVFWFIFADKSACQRMADSFWCNQAMVNAREFYNAMRTLKDVIFRRRQR